MHKTNILYTLLTIWLLSIIVTSSISFLNLSDHHFVTLNLTDDEQEEQQEEVKKSDEEKQVFAKKNIDLSILSKEQKASTYNIHLLGNLNHVLSIFLPPPQLLS